MPYKDIEQRRIYERQYRVAYRKRPERKAYTATYKAKNAQRIKERNLKYYWANKEKHRGRVAKYRGTEKWRIRQRQQVLRVYGISIEQYNRMLECQKGLCAICEKHMKRPHVDHNHSTDKVRALLCAGCNGKISLMEDDYLFGKAIKYLTQHSEI